MEAFAACWDDLDDPRRGNAGLHDFHELPMIALCAVLCGGQGAVDMARFAREAAHGQCVGLRAAPGAGAGRNRCESNEITAVPKLLAMLSLKGAIVTADAINCQRAIAAEVVRQGGDYALALKGNQGMLHDDVVRFLGDPHSTLATSKPEVDAGHGRVERRRSPGIETRTASVSTDIAWLQDGHRWPGLQAIGKVCRTRETAAGRTAETAYYLLSTPLSPDRLNAVVRHHGEVENRLHWRLDVVMNEDQDRTRLGHGPQNLAILRHMALNAMQQEPSKDSLRGKIQRAAWNDAYLTKVLALL